MFKNDNHKNDSNISRIKKTSKCHPLLVTFAKNGFTKILSKPFSKGLLNSIAIPERIRITTKLPAVLPICCLNVFYRRVKSDFIAAWIEE